jgi:hypothetical protein
MRRAFVIPFSIMAAAWLGCSDRLPRTIPVEGQVTYRGKPVTQGSVTFMPADSAQGAALQPATGRLESDGSYRLRSYRQKDGVLPGKYAVSVAAYRSSRLPMTPGEKPDYSVPEKYVSPQTSGLTATVPADAVGTLRFDFELRD